MPAMTSQKQLSIVIVNFNTAPVLAKCLENLKQIDPGWEIILVDNASTDGSADLVKNHFPTVELLELTENKGLAAGYNLGLAKASGEFILFLGSDAFPEKEAILGLLDYLAKHSEVGIATCQLVLRSGQPDLDAHRGFPTPWVAFTHFSHLDELFPGSKLFDGYFLGFKNLNEPQEIDLCLSHFMLVRRSVFASVGKFDEDFFVYGEDVDFCYRVKQKGWQIMYLPQWRALHYKGVSVGVRPETQDITQAASQTRRRMSRESAEAMLTFYKKHYLRKYPWWLTFLIFLAIWFKKKIRSQRFR